MFGAMFEGAFNGISGIDMDERNLGDPLVPFFQFDLNYQNVESDIYALDGRAELGFGSFGAFYRRTYYKEDIPDDSMNVHQIMGMLRLSNLEHAELDVGLGSLTLDRAYKTSGLSITTPYRVHLDSGLGFELRPSWSRLNGNTIQDYDLKLIYTYEFFSAKVGYRWFLTDGANLNGVQFGASVHF